MARIQDIISANWQLSAATFAQVVEGADSYNQSIILAVTTRQGSDPFRPTFGSDIWQYIDKPVNVAASGIVRAIRNAVALWVPGITITSLRYSYQDSNGDPNGLPSGLRFDLTWQPTGGASAGDLSILLTTQSAGGATVPALIRILSTESGAGITSETGQFIALI